MKIYSTNNGFTLLEMLVSLTLMGIIGSIWGIGLIQIADSFILSKQNTETAQKGQMAITRLIKEFQSIEYIYTSSDVPSAPPSSIYIKYSRDTEKTDVHWISFSSDELKINDDTNEDILINLVNNFSMIYYDKYNIISADPADAKMIEIKLELNTGIKDNAGNNISQEFSTFVFLRGLV